MYAFYSVILILATKNNNRKNNPISIKTIGLYPSNIKSTRGIFLMPNSLPSNNTKPKA